MLGNRNQTKHVHDALTVDNNYRVPENSRGRYLIVVGEDADLGGSQENQKPTMVSGDWGQPRDGGADIFEIGKKFSWGSFLGGYRSFSYNQQFENLNVWPNVVKNNEYFDPTPALPSYPTGIHNNYSEPVINTNFLLYLKSRGFIVDIAIMDRKNFYSNYNMAHPDDVPDYADFIPYVSEDWSKIRHQYGDQVDWIYGQEFWRPSCLWAHIQYYRNKYKDTDHPLKYVLLLGEPCVMLGGYMDLVRGSQCIPGFNTKSYSFENMRDFSDWPYHWDPELIIQAYQGYGYTEEQLSHLNFETYEDVVTACSEGFPNAFDEISVNLWGTLYNKLDESQDDMEKYLKLKSLIEPDYHVGRISSKLKNDTNRYQFVEHSLNKTVGYHNFQNLHISNSPVCHSVDGGNPAYGVCKKPEWDAPSNLEVLPQDWGLYQDENFPDYNCRITGEDAIMAGCESGNCIWFSEDCSDWSEMEYFKEYLGNSIHIGVNYAGTQG